MTDAQKIEALSDLLGDVIHTLNLKKYDICLLNTSDAAEELPLINACGAATTAHKQKKQ